MIKYILVETVRQLSKLGMRMQRVQRVRVTIWEVLVVLFAVVLFTVARSSVASAGQHKCGKKKHVWHSFYFWLISCHHKITRHDIEFNLKGRPIVCVRALAIAFIVSPRDKIHIILCEIILSQNSLLTLRIKHVFSFGAFWKPTDLTPTA